MNKTPAGYQFPPQFPATGGDPGETKEHFLLEAARAVGVGGECGRDNLYRDFAAQARVARAVDFAHSSRAKRRENFLRAEPGTSSERHASRPRLYRFRAENRGMEYSATDPEPLGEFLERVRGEQNLKVLTR